MEDRWRTDGGQMEDRWRTDGGQMEDRWRTDGGKMEGAKDRKQQHSETRSHAHSQLSADLAERLLPLLLLLARPGIRDNPPPKRMV